MKIACKTPPPWQSEWREIHTHLFVLVDTLLMKIEQRYNMIYFLHDDVT